MSRTATRVEGFPQSVFSKWTQLANQHQAINLGQGFPDFPAPDFVKQAALEAISADINQYAPCRGRANLRQAIANHIERTHGLHYDPATEITVTIGASEGIQATIFALVDPDDEVIVFEPFYDTYVPNVLFAGGTPVYYPLQAPDWTIERDRLAALITPKTKLIILNTPHNPTGKLVTQAELQVIADLCIEHDLYVMSDDVYETLVYDGLSHTPLASLDGMRERTITLGSIGKTFSVTGWKVGWATGSADLIDGLVTFRQFASFAGANPLQHASAVVLEQAAQHGYFEQLRQQFQQRRDMLLSALADAGMPAIKPDGGYFAMVDISNLGFEDDVTFCHHLTTEVGVTAIPPSAFYSRPELGRDLARFAFCKSESVLYDAAKRLNAASTKLHTF